MPCSEIENAYERMRCSRPTIERVVQNVSAQEALDQVYALQASDFIADCHVPSHWIGEANLKKYDDDVGTAFATCANGCFEGCHHGVIESYISMHGEESVTTEFCDELASGDQILYRQCLHGMGHALMRHHIIPLEDAILMCNTLETAFARETCEAGVLMEFTDIYIELGKEEFIARVPTICEGLSGEIKRSCIGSIGYAAMVVTGHITDESESICSILNDQSHVEECVYEVYEEEKINRQDLQRHMRLQN